MYPVSFSTKMSEVKKYSISHNYYTEDTVPEEKKKDKCKDKSEEKIMERMKEKYRSILQLGNREPVIVLEDCCTDMQQLCNVPLSQILAHNIFKINDKRKNRIIEKHEKYKDLKSEEQVRRNSANHRSCLEIDETTNNSANKLGMLQQDINLNVIKLSENEIKETKVVKDIRDLRELNKDSKGSCAMKKYVVSNSIFGRTKRKHVSKTMPLETNHDKKEQPEVQENSKKLKGSLEETINYKNSNIIIDSDISQALQEDNLKDKTTEVSGASSGSILGVLDPKCKKEIILNRSNNINLRRDNVLKNSDEVDNRQKENDCTQSERTSSKISSTNFGNLAIETSHEKVNVQKKKSVTIKDNISLNNTFRINVRNVKLNEDNIKNTVTCDSNTKIVSGNNFRELSNVKDNSASPDYSKDDLSILEIETRRENGKNYGNSENNLTEENRENGSFPLLFSSTPILSSNVDSFDRSEAFISFERINSITTKGSDYTVNDCNVKEDCNPRNIGINEETNGKMDTSGESENSLKRKGGNANEIHNNETTKKVKLNRNHWYQQRRRSNDISVCSSKSNAESVADTDNMKGDARRIESGTDQGTSDAKVRSFGIVDSDQECIDTNHPLQGAQSDNDVVTKPAEEQYFLSDKGSSRGYSTDEDDDKDDDCISLFAESILLTDETIKDSSLQQRSRNSANIEKPYHMTDNMFENYYNNTKAEFDKAYNICNGTDDKTYVSNEEHVQDIMPLMATYSYPPPLLITNFRPNGSAAMLRYNKNDINPSKAIRGYCFAKLKSGNCPRYYCRFNHDFFQLFSKLNNLYTSDEQQFFKVIKKMASMNFEYGISNLCEQLASDCGDIMRLLKVLKKLYELNALNTQLLSDAVQHLKETGAPTKLIADYASRIVNTDDTRFSKLIVDVLKEYIDQHQFWYTMKSLLVKIKDLDAEIINIILLECLTRRVQVQEVNEHILRMLDHKTLSELNQEHLSSFQTLLQYTSTVRSVTQETQESQSVPSISSPDERIGEELHVSETPCNNACETKETDNNNNSTLNKQEHFKVHPIDDLPRPYSVQGREVFWKFYLQVHSLQEGLRHEDDEHVKEILDNANKEIQRSMFARACYTILRKEAESSQHRLSKLKSLAVRTGATSAFYEIMLNVVTRIIRELTDKELWVLALMLLKDIRIMFSYHKFDAATILLFSQIYLANRRPVKAFTLLKQTNIICTNRTKWNVPSTAKDVHTRAQVIAILLNILCEQSSDHAYYLFKCLITDQCSNFYPVDLTYAANKIVSIFLLGNDQESTVSIGRLLDQYSIVLDTITHRALVASLVHTDLTLAKQLYQKAVALGMYSKIQFHPITYVIINSDWTNEEMYLIILDLLEQLSINIGHAIDRIRPRHFAVYLVFEYIPPDKKLAYDKGFDDYDDKKIKESKLLMKRLLENQFDPSISMITKRRGKLCKLNSASLIAHLRTGHY